MKLVYVLSPFSGPNKEANIQRAEHLCRMVLDAGHVPFAPYLFFPQFLDDEDENDRQLGIDSGLELMKRFDIVLAYVGHGVSKGMRYELNRAYEAQEPRLYTHQGKPLRVILIHDQDEIKEVLQ